MASKRKLKKWIHYVCETLILDVFVFMPESTNDTDTFRECVMSVAELEREFVKRVSHIEKLNARKHYRALIDDFTSQAVAIAEKYIATAE